MYTIASPLMSKSPLVCHKTSASHEFFVTSKDRVHSVVENSI